MTENLCTLQAQLKAVDRAIQRQKLLDKLAKIPVHHRNMAKREQLEKALKAL